MATTTVSIYQEIKGVKSELVDLTDFQTETVLGGGDGSSEVTTLIKSEGVADLSSLRAQVNNFNRIVANINPPDSAIARDSYESKHVRLFLGVKLNGEPNVWLAEITGGAAKVTEDQLGSGQYNTTGFFQFEIRHKPVFTRLTALEQGFVGRDNNANNYYGVDLSGYMGPDVGDLPALADAFIKPTGGGATMARAYIGVGRGVSNVSSLIGTFASKNVTVNSTAVELVSGGNAITLANYPSGYTMPIIRLDSLPPAVTGLQISADGKRWFDIENAHAIHRTELLYLPVSRVGGVTAAGYQLHVWLRYVDPTLTSGNATLPAGSIHLFPCDQFIDYAINGSPVASGQVMTHLATRNIAYINTGSAGVFESVIPRPLQGIQLANDLSNLTVLIEASDGTAPAGKAFDFHLDFWPRRRQA